jgi:hypothetical protein
MNGGFMRKITVLILWLTVGLLSLWDVFAMIKGRDSTISVIMWDNAQLYPMIPFAFGVLMGHLFWQFKRPKA